MMLGTRSCGCCLQRYSSFCKEFHQCILLPDTTLFFPVVLFEMIRQTKLRNKFTGNRMYVYVFVSVSVLNYWPGLIYWMCLT